jgi:hypothetical protein
MWATAIYVKLNVYASTNGKPPAKKGNVDLRLVSVRLYNEIGKDQNEWSDSL